MAGKITDELYGHSWTRPGKEGKEVGSKIIYFAAGWIKNTESKKKRKLRKEPLPQVT